MSNEPDASPQKARKTPLPFWCFSLVFVRLGRRFLLVQERKHGQTWYIPAGRVEPGEGFAEAARREVEEESGIEVVLDGILRVEISPPRFRREYRQRIIFTAYPVDDRPPRTFANEESLGARWVTIEEAERMNLRGAEVLDGMRYIASGRPIYPLSICAQELDPL